MSAKSIDKFAGVLSILWTVGGFVLLRFGLAAFPELFRSAQPAVLVICSIIWFGFSLLLITAGLRRGTKPGRVYSLCALAFLFWLAEPLHGFGNRVGNLFRKDEYARMYYGAPECRVTTAIHTDQEVAAFYATVRHFAKDHDIRECRQKRYMSYSGPPRPTYKGEHVAMFLGVSYGTNASQKTGGIRLAPYDEAYPEEDFKRLADSLASTMRSAFPDRVEVTYKEAEKRKNLTPINQAGQPAK